MVPRFASCCAQCKGCLTDGLSSLALVPSVVWLEVVCMFLALQALMPPPRLSKLVQMLF
jgi:hypothetical protein